MKDIQALFRNALLHTYKTYTHPSIHACMYMHTQIVMQKYVCILTNIYANAFLHTRTHSIINGQQSCLFHKIIYISPYSGNTLLLQQCLQKQVGRVPF